jgi:hypothetical protein
MKLAEGIRKHGFRKWYERELLLSHVHLALTFMCLVGIFAALEAASRFRSWADQLTDLVALVACVGAGLWALRRYLYLLSNAEAAANQAQCSSCGTYGRLELVAVHEGQQCVQVRCRQCQHEWLIAE